jgi:hypothetical protein
MFRPPAGRGSCGQYLARALDRQRLPPLRPTLLPRPPFDLSQRICLRRKGGGEVGKGRERGIGAATGDDVRQAVSKAREFLFDIDLLNATPR